VSQVYGGGLHTAVLFNDGTVKCWGYNNEGQLGYGNIEDLGDEAGEMGNNLPVVDLGIGRTAVQIAAGGNHTVALLDNGTIKCWGRNDRGQLGYGDTESRGDEAGEMGNILPAVDL
jgi:alpha-tubulin suppressor-like RCC1 family protein